MPDWKMHGRAQYGDFSWGMENGNESQSRSRDLIVYLQNYIEKNIPITKHMGLRVESYHEGEVTLKAPLLPNTNDKQTGFAGSIYSVAVLCGWSLVHLLLKEHGFVSDQVISEANMQYLKPVNDDFQAMATLSYPSEEQKGKMLQDFLSRIHAGKKGKLSVQVDVRSDETIVARLSGVYYAWQKDDGL